MTDALLVSTALLWIVVAVLCLVVLALVRQIGLLHERIAPVGALLANPGLRIGEPAPVLTASDLDGRDVRIGGAASAGTVLFFLSPTCPVCKTLLPTVLRAAREETPPLRVVLASDGDLAEHRRFVAEHGLTDTTYVLSSALGMSYQVAKLPYAVLIDRGGILRAMGLVNTREHLESLFEAQRLGFASIQEYLSRGEHPAEVMENGGTA